VSKKLAIGIFVFILVFLSVLYFTGRRSGTPGFFEIKSGQTAGQISKNLVKEGFLNSHYPFYAYVLLRGKTDSLKSGFYSFPLEDNFLDIANKIINGDTYKIKITFPEGFTLKDVDQRLAESGFSFKVVLGDVAAGDFEKDFDFLKDASEGATLEGYLFPDTYYFDLDMTAGEIAEVFLKNFDQKFAPYEELALERGQSVFDVITMASLIEKEVKSLEDKKLVSGIFWKRIRLGMPLQSCATIAYVLGVDKWIYSFEDTRTPSPYNTYLQAGLPAGPIANPGLESIIASLYPEESNYLYYLSTPEGETVFSRTLSEHNVAKAKYLR
jgi:UPF0755 protein